MACHPSSSYTVVIIPLKSSIGSLEALRFYLWIRRLKDLEEEKDALWCGMEILEKARLWYIQRLRENRTQQNEISSKSGTRFCQNSAAKVRSCVLRSCIQRVNGSLGSVMSDPNVTSGGNLSLAEAIADSELRWHNSVLTQELGAKNRQISSLELEKDALLCKLLAS